jgi:hypothetical protein
MHIHDLLVPYVCTQTYSNIVSTRPGIKSYGITCAGLKHQDKNIKSNIKFGDQDPVLLPHPPLFPHRRQGTWFCYLLQLG